MTIIGENKSTALRYERNILPPFDSGEWSLHGIKENNISAFDYEVSFVGSKYCGLVYDLPNSVLGKTVSLSVESLEGDGKPLVFIRYYQNGERKQHLIRNGYSDLSSDNIFIPIDANTPTVKVESPVEGMYNYVKNIQLEYGVGSLPFKARKKGLREASYGVRLDGVSGYILTKNSLSSITKHGRFTVEAIVKINGEGSGDVIFQNSLAADDRNGLVYSGTGFRMGYYDGSSWKGVGATFPRGEWAHIIATNTNGNLRMFVNGLPSTTTSSLYVHTSSSAMYIGKPSVETRGCIGMDIRLLRVYDYVLSDEEIMRNYDGEPSRKKISLELDFSNQDRETGTIKDSSGKGNDATLYDGARFIGSTVKKGHGKNMVDRKRIVLNYMTGGSDIEGENFQYIANDYRAFLMVPVKPNTSYAIQTDTMQFYTRGLRNEFLEFDGVVRGWLKKTVYTSTPTTRFLAFNIKKEDNSVVTQDDLDNLKMQIEEGEIHTEFEEYRGVNHGVRDVKAKSSFRDFGFNFSRSGFAEDRGRLTPMNTPRLMFGGLVIEEESSRNMIKDVVDGSWGWSRDTSDVSLERTEEMEPYQGKKVTKWTKGSKSNTGNVYLHTVDDIDDSIPSSHWTFSCYLKRADGLPVTSVGSVYMYMNDASTGSRLNSNKSPTYIQECEDGWYRVVREDYHVNKSTISLVGFASLDGTTDWYFSGWRLEPNNLATLYHEMDVEKSRDYAWIDNISQYLDPEKGSLELVLTPLSGHAQQPGGYGYQDLSCYSSGGFIIRRNRNYVGEVELAMNHGSASYFSVDAQWESGKELKYRLEWNNVLDQMKFTVNDGDEKIGKGLRMPSKSLDIGHRDMGHTSGNAVYKSLVIRDKWGRTTFQL